MPAVLRTKTGARMARDGTLPRFTEADQFVLDLQATLASDILAGERAHYIRLACAEAGLDPRDELEVARRVAMVDTVYARVQRDRAQRAAQAEEAVRQAKQGYG